MGRVRLIAVGDVHPNAEEPDKVFELVSSTLSSADVLYGQLECIISDAGVPRTDVRNPFHRVSPRNLRALSAAGFKVLSFASNNALDYGLDPFLETINRLHAIDIQVVGAGSNVYEARQPVVMEANGVTLAFVSACSILRDGYSATPNRPGVAPLNVLTLYDPLENIYEQPGTPARTLTFPDPDDIESVLDSIRAAKKKADIVIACFHWGVHFVYDLALYQPEVAYSAIDAGADLVIGTHPHCLQAFDVYRGKVIAYSLGNFVFEQSAGSIQGVSEYLSYYGIPVDHTSSHNPHPKHTKLTGMLVCDIEDRVLVNVAFRPVLISDDGCPRLLEVSDPEYRDITELVTRLSSEIGTIILEDRAQLTISTEKLRAIDTRRVLWRRKDPYPSLRYLGANAE